MEVCRCFSRRTGLRTRGQFYPSQARRRAAGVQETDALVQAEQEEISSRDRGRLFSLYV